MPRIATSGELTIGVNDVPPMPPRLVIVKHAALHLVERQLAGARLLGDLGQLRRQLGDALRVDVADDRHEQAAIGVDGDADVRVLLVDQLPAARVDRRVELRELLQRGGDDLHRDGRDRQLAAGALDLRSPLLPQLLEAGDVGLVVLRDVRDRRPRVREVLGGLAADVAPSAAARPRPTCAKSGSAGDGAAAPDDGGAAPPPDITCRTYPFTSSTEMRPPGPVPGTWRDVDAELARDAADRRRGGRRDAFAGRRLRRAVWPRG